MTYLLAQYAAFLAITKENPVVAGVAALWGAGIMTFALRNVPQKIGGFLYRQFTTTLSFNNAGYGNAEMHFVAFMEWLIETRYAGFGRTFSLESNDDDGYRPIIGAGFGTHFFFFKKRLFWATKSKLPSTGTTTEKQEFVICGLTRSQRVINELVEAFRRKQNPKSIRVYSWDSRDWESTAEIAKRDLRTVVMNRELKATILNRIEQFIASEEWYRARGLTYKLSQIFYGLPGTGKTSLIKSLAGHYGRDVYVLSLSEMSDKSLLSALAAVPKNGIVLIEDFDGANSTKTRERTESAEEGGDDSSLAGLVDRLTLSGLLNALDGVIGLDSLMIFLTTNHLDKIDPAILRKGRIDHIYEIPYLEDAEIRDFTEIVFPGANLPTDVCCQPVAGCDLQALFFEHRESYLEFEQQLARV